MFEVSPITTVLLSLLHFACHNCGHANQKQQFLAVASFTNQFLTGMHKAITMFEVSLKAHKQLENNFPKRTEWRWFPLH